MTEDVSLAKIQAINEVIQKNLCIVQQVLESEAVNDDDLSQDDLGKVEAESEVAAEKAIGNFPKRRLTAAELMEEKNYLFAMRDANRIQFVKNQAMFAESVAKFNQTKDKFARRTKIRKQYF